MKVLSKVKTLGSSILVELPRGVTLDDGEYQVEFIPKAKMKRTDRQNAYMWKVVNAICNKIDGNTRGNYDMYCQLLEMAGTTYWDYRIDDGALDDARKLLKHVKVVHQDVLDGKIIDYCWVFRGISEMGVEEASKLIDTAKYYAGEVGVDVEEYERWFL